MDRYNDIRDALAAPLAAIPRDQFEAIVTAAGTSRDAAKREAHARRFDGVASLLCEWDESLTPAIVEALVQALALEPDAERALLAFVKRERRAFEKEMAR